MTLSKLLTETFNAAQLTHLARLTGASTSSRTKAALAQGIQHAAHASITQANQATPLRILSIDVGIKNLAYCTLESNIESNGTSTPLVRSWRRLSVINTDSNSHPHPEAEAEIYSTPSLAQAASDLIHDIVLQTSTPPSHILIERQRWRTGGGPNILQWTIRVNSFEAMLWAALSALRQQGFWMGEVHAVNPALVAGLWLPKGEKGQKGLTTMRKYQALKLAKTKLLKDWVREGSVVRSGGLESDGLFALLGEGMEGAVKGDRGRRGVAVGNDKMKLDKLDDLVDCLIQGVTWLCWLKNSRMLAERGLDGARELLLQTVPGVTGDV